MEIGTGVTIALAIVGALVWAVRQEGRVNNHDVLHIQHQKRAEEIRIEALDRDENVRAEALERDSEMRNTATVRYGELREELRYFRQRIDAWMKAP